MTENFGPYYQKALTGGGSPSSEEIDLMARYMEAPQPALTTGMPSYSSYSPYVAPEAPDSQIGFGKLGTANISTSSNPATEGVSAEGVGGYSGEAVDTSVSGSAAPYGGNLGAAAISGALSGGISSGTPEGAVMGGINAIAGGLGQIGGPAITAMLGLDPAPPQANPLVYGVGLDPTTAGLVKGAATTGTSLLSPYAAPAIPAISTIINAITGQNISRDVVGLILGPVNSLLQVPVVGPFLTGLVADPLAAIINSLFSTATENVTLSQSSVTGMTADQSMGLLSGQVDIGAIPGAMVEGPLASQTIDTSEYGYSGDIDTGEPGQPDPGYSGDVGGYTGEAGQPEAGYSGDVGGYTGDGSGEGGVGVDAGGTSGEGSPGY